MIQYTIAVEGMGLLHVRGSYQRCGAKGISREEGHLVPEQEGDHSSHGNGTGRGCPACSYFATGYEVGEIRKEPWAKKGLFGR